MARELTSSGQKAKFQDNQRTSALASKAETLAYEYTPYVAAGFFFGFVAVFGATGSAPRSIDVRRPAVKV